MRKIIAYSMMACLIVPPPLWAAPQAGNTRQVTVLPDFLNYDKFNVPRECSPAEKYKGKTNCHICDADTPNVVLNYDGRTSRIIDAVIIDGNHAGAYQRDNYHNAWNQKTTTSGRVFNLMNRSGGRGINVNITGSRDARPLVVLHGYNLTGYAWGVKGENAVNDPTNLYPMNMRTKCETFRPKYSYAEAIAKGDNSGFRGASILSVGGLALSAGALKKITDPKGNKGTGMALGGGKAATSVGSGMYMDSMPRRSFVCLEYYTKRNGVSDNGQLPTDIGGQHIMLNPTHSTDCQLPLQTFYNTFVPEGCPYYPCDGNANGVFSPATKMLRYLYLMGNPFFMYGRTAFESWQAAYERPDTMMGY